MAIHYNEEKLIELCRKYGLSLVVLHDSYAKGITHLRSDVDIGFLGEPEIIKRKHLDIAGDSSAIFGDKFDPVFLNGAEAMISYHVAMNGKPLYEKTRGLFNSFRMGAIGRYLDTKIFRVLEKQYIRSAIQKRK